MVGELGADQRGQIYFQYDTDWLKTGFDLSPGTMPFNDAVQLSAEPHEFNGLHGVFNDSLPDGWGLLLMDRALQHFAGWQRNEITPLDRLAYIVRWVRSVMSLPFRYPLTLTLSISHYSQSRQTIYLKVKFQRYSISCKFRVDHQVVLDQR
jgi:hypothetical protein